MIKKYERETYNRPMDLDRCPKCGGAWPGGDKCRACGFVPVGSGLENLPKKKKKKVRKYVEPGSSRGFLNTVLVCGLGYASYVYQPWKDDWELIRSLMGQGRHHSIVGDWEIRKVVAISTTPTTFEVDKGKFKFSDKGDLGVQLVKNDESSEASGKYIVSGPKVEAVNVSESKSSAGQIPSNFAMVLAWTGANSVVATVGGNKAIYLSRHESGKSLSPMLQFGFKPDKVEAPGQMRGVMTTMRDNIKDSEQDGN